MSNSTDQLSPASRAMLVSALLGGSASGMRQWQAYQQGEVEIDQAVQQVLRDAGKTALAGGAATAIAGQLAGRPVLSMLTILSAGAAGLYLLDELKGKPNEEN
ncbi:hypothetical protein [uncultured Photobacterium sp.]|uniref:hypothetical protein n=1 Tax=uncultured Photobacterium sp. TaxID=173973 RepID=UPI002629B714|nr:hypothetical protein [uncultured Photobacterium sp.]